MENPLIRKKDILKLNHYNADMYIQVQGSKREIHNWQHEKILDYMYVTDQYPLLNKSLW